MQKHVRICAVLFFAFFTVVFINSATLDVSANTCRSISECRELQRATRDNIADLVDQENELGIDLAQLQEEISQLRVELSALLESIDILESEISDLTNRIFELSDKIELNIILYDETNERIDYLLDEVSQRMRITQRRINTNDIFSALVEAQSIVDFVRVSREINRIANRDADFMNELNSLIKLQQQILLELQEMTEELEEIRYARRASVAMLEIEQEYLESVEYELVGREFLLQDTLDALYAERVSEESRLAALLQAEEILSRTPAPPTTAPGGPTAQAPTTPQIPNESGLAHPMPGARVSSEFGNRWGGWHAGIDVEIFANPRTPVLSAAAGTVITSNFNNSMGWYVIISHNINGQRVDTLYGHLRYQGAAVGSVVYQGQQIGIKGSTGFSTGPHLHFEVHPGGFSWNSGVNPRDWIAF